MITKILTPASANIAKDKLLKPKAAKYIFLVIKKIIQV